MSLKINGVVVIDDSQNIAPVGIMTVGNSKIQENKIELGVGVTFDGSTGNMTIAGDLSAGTINLGLGAG